MVIARTTSLDAGLIAVFFRTLTGTADVSSFTGAVGHALENDATLASAKIVQPQRILGRMADWTRRRAR
jgi:hypothetical protein